MAHCVPEHPQRVLQVCQEAAVTLGRAEERELERGRPAAIASRRSDGGEPRLVDAIVGRQPPQLSDERGDVGGVVIVGHHDDELILEVQAAEAGLERKPGDLPKEGLDAGIVACP